VRLGGAKAVSCSTFSGVFLFVHRVGLDRFPYLYIMVSDGELWIKVGISG